MNLFEAASQDGGSRYSAVARRMGRDARRLSRIAARSERTSAWRATDQPVDGRVVRGREITATVLDSHGDGDDFNAGT